MGTGGTGRQGDVTLEAPCLRRRATTAKRLSVCSLSLLALLFVWPAAAGETVTLAAGEGESSNHPAPLEPLKTIHCGALAAHFMGVREPLSPVTYGVRELWFTFEDESRRYRFHPEGTLHFSDWYFDHLFSPTCTYVLLLQDRFGPYHVVRGAHLKGYLLDRRGPDHIVGDDRVAGEAAGVFSDATWVSDDEVRYSFTCCGETETRYEILPRK